LYVIAYVLGTYVLLGYLFRERPAKIVIVCLFFPSALLAGFLDGSAEGGRLLNSRIFFTLNVACLLFYMALVSLKLGAYADYTFQVGTFGFVASSMVCNSIATLLVFGVKNIALSFYEPGSLVVLKSAVCCVFLDADALAVLKGAYSLIGQSLGKYAPNKTIETYLKRQRLSMVEFIRGPRGPMPGGNAVAPAHVPEATIEAPDDELSVLNSSGTGLLVDIGLHPEHHGSVDSNAVTSASGSGSGCLHPDVPMQASPAIRHPQVACLSVPAHESFVHNRR
jgi:hypothetical protein